MKFNSFVGIDISKEVFDLVVRKEDGSSSQQQFPNSIPGIHLFIEWMVKENLTQESTLICMEHTGNYIDRITRLLSGEGYFAWVVSPLVIHKFSPDIRRHSDDQDSAERLCEFAARFSDQARRFEPDSKEEAKLRALSLLRKQLVKSQTQFLNRELSNLDLADPSAMGAKVYRETIEFFQNRIQLVEDEIEALIKSSAQLSSWHTILKSVPGIGKVCATMILIHTCGFKKIKDFKSFASFIASAPFSKGSGKYKVRPRVYKTGNRKAKSLLFMGAMSLIHPGRIFHNWYIYRTEVQKKHPFSVLNEIINEIIKIAFTLIQRGEKFNKVKYLEGKNSVKFLGLS
ncbi:MAG: IS110 family transposase [Bacteroidia bacterium]|nr:IS110 family transposase [Bacteroidia bacterium]MCB9230988.1 IS110 family transposase [Bacteroidia bacterium]MCB9231328.1 IS110 family transposase [Bacteroidia bacterium]MCB9232120.1 IS110 family transposase [Bacteroidia bacterium]MCB9234480.1 IS110 family transposase [Bacteroidia bacterium]